jgi:hypothetical protein
MRIMNHRFGFTLAMFGVGALAGCSIALADEVGVGPAPAVAPGALQAAHEAYLDGSFVVLGERIRDVLLDPIAGDLVKQNAYELLDKAYEAEAGRLPSRFTLPPGYDTIQYVVFRNLTPNGTSYTVHLREFARDASHLVGLTVRRLPGEVLLDKATGKGHFAMRHVKVGVDEIVLDSGPVAAPPDDGVISFRIELDDGTAAEGFAIAHTLVATATPEVRSPAPWSALSDPHPLVAWTPFRSPEAFPFERRVAGMEIEREGRPGVLWQAWTDRPDEHHEARIGVEPVASDSVALSPGDYGAIVVGGESRSFGSVDLIRGARTLVPFRITP